MNNLIQKFNIKNSRLKKSLLDGFYLSDNQIIISKGSNRRRTIFFRTIDSGQKDCYWGRFTFNLDIHNDCVVNVKAFASNERCFSENGETIDFDDFFLREDIDINKKEDLFEYFNCVNVAYVSDLLLYGISGRYICIFIEVIGDGESNLSDFILYSPGDNFFNTLPEVYRRDNGFLHRYMSIFSSIYWDLQNKIDNFDNLIDIENTDNGLLLVFMSWLGIELDGDFLEEEHLKSLAKISFDLIKNKGTKKSISDIIKIFVQEPFYIVEQHGTVTNVDNNLKDVYKNLYGKNPYDFTILINRVADEKLYSKLMFLIHQFKPIRCNANIIFLGEVNSMNFHCYLDINARLFSSTEGYLDSKMVLSDMITLC